MATLRGPRATSVVAADRIVVRERRASVGDDAKLRGRPATWCSCAA